MTFVDAEIEIEIEQVCFELMDFAAAARLMRRLSAERSAARALRGAIRRRRGLPVGIG